MLEQTFVLSNISRELVLTMVSEEQRVRYSKPIQNAYTMQYNAAKNNPYYEKINIERMIQQHILQKFGFSTDINSLEEYWKIPSTYWNDEEVKTAIFYMKLNIFQYPHFKKGDALEDCNLIQYPSNELISLSSLHTNKPLVILAGSMT
jgi:hypothetical protein